MPTFMKFRPHTAILPLLVVVSAMLGACGKAPDASTPTKTADAAKPGEAAKTAPFLISKEDLVTVANGALSSGPSITGSVQPERRADLRAELAGVVMQVVRENGDNVRRGELLVRIDDSAIRESLLAADAGVRSATQAAEQTSRQFERMKTLRASGMTSAQALEDAETRRNNAQSDLETAKTRAAQARQQLTRTEVRAPFNGIVSDRKVSAGDTAQIGKELVKVIDPSSMRFEGLISADRVGSVKAGQRVTFQVNGYGDQEFVGKIRRVNPSANAATRQVEVLVDFVGDKQPKLAGLYAEGRVETASVAALTIPASAMVRDGDKATVWQVKDGLLKKITLTLGERDLRTGDFVVTAGALAGDTLVRYPGATLKDGQKIEMTGPPVAAAPKSAPPEPQKTSAAKTETDAKQARN